MRVCWSTFLQVCCCCHCVWMSQNGAGWRIAASAHAELRRVQHIEVEHFALPCMSNPCFS